MLPFLVLHICALLVWSAGLLYLPALLTQGPTLVLQGQPSLSRDSLARWLFTRVVTPVALVAIMAGTAVFLINRTTAPWLIAKLTLVCMLVICHALAGLLIARSEIKQLRHIKFWQLTLTIGVCATLLAILWTVLAKPDLGGVG